MEKKKKMHQFKRQKKKFSEDNIFFGILKINIFLIFNSLNF